MHAKLVARRQGRAAAWTLRLVRVVAAGFECRRLCREAVHHAPSSFASASSMRARNAGSPILAAGEVGPAAGLRGVVVRYSRRAKVSVRLARRILSRLSLIGLRARLIPLPLSHAGRRATWRRQDRIAVLIFGADCQIATVVRTPSAKVNQAANVALADVADMFVPEQIEDAGDRVFAHCPNDVMIEQIAFSARPVMIETARNRCYMSA